MPRVKIDYVVSFSSEDPDNPASNLLGWEVSKKRWLCAKGEPSCSVVLQLTRAVKINAVHIGAHHAALVEVLVGRSETPNEPFQVLVPSCVFLSPAESRRDEAAARVRSFAAEQLAPARAQRWDRLRLVCSQPYNKHCKYGLNFVQVYTPEGASPPRPAPAAALPAPGADADASSGDEFTPGELFARHRAAAADDTGAQIRQATSQALNNISESAAKLVKTAIQRPPRAAPATAAARSRQRPGLLYTDDDDKPHSKIDHIVQRHKDEKTKEEAAKPKASEKHDKHKKDKNESFRREASKNDSLRDSDRSKDRIDRTPKEDKKQKPSSAREVRDEPSTSTQSDSDNKKRSREKQKETKGPRVELRRVLEGVVLALSGYVNPRRSAVRELALALGARVERDWTPRCTHLICAFPNTPKLKQVRASPGGARVPVATAEWVERCGRARRRLPWRAFATEPALRAPAGGGGDGDEDGDQDEQGSPQPQRDDDECDTDDEIEQALRKQKKRRTDRSRSPDRASQPQPRPESRSRSHDVSAASDVEFVRDERMQGNVTVTTSDDDDTEEETDAGRGRASIEASSALPDLFQGRTFVIDASAAQPRLLARYVRAYGGLVLQEEELEAGGAVDFVLSARARRGAGLALRPAWLWRCHRRRALLPPRDYLLT